jgi:outer membrane protein OmpA-like peptidoglycan-associated protein
MKRIIPFFLIFASQSDIFAQTQVPNNDKVMIINEKSVNSPSLEYSPTFYQNGIVFISTDAKSGNKVFDERQGKKTSSIQIARRGPLGVLTEPEIFAPELTTSLNDGPVAFDRGNETIYFSTNHQKKGKKIKAKDGYVKQKIQFSKIVNDKWQAAEDLPFNNVEYSICHPTVSVDGTVLYFASNKPDGFGGMDIYSCRKVGEVWGEVVNLGATINSDKDEIFPFIHPDGTLYFASNSARSIGGLDIFSSKMVAGKYSTPENIGKPFNSEDDDFGFILDLERKNGYFTSNRKGGKGEDDIYSFSSTEKIGAEVNKNIERTISIYTTNKINGNNVEGTAIKVMPLSEYEIGDLVTDNDGNIIRLMTTDSTNILTSIGENKAQMLSTNFDGKAETKLKNGDYLVNFSKKGYQTKQTILNVNSERDEFMVLLENLEAESVPIAGTLKNNRGVPIANATITLNDDAGGEPQVFKTDNKGNYKYYVKPNTNYTISATKDNHLAASSRFNSGTLKDGATEIPVNLDMPEITTPLPTGKIFQLNNVYYNYNDATLRPDAKQDLDPLVSLLKTYPEVEIELSSHTDSRGAGDFNQTLSQRRAESVVKYLTDKGISASRLKAKGYGESKLRNNCADGVTCTENEHQMNRRTEVKVTRGGNDLDVAVLDKFFKGTTTFQSNPSETNSNNSGNSASTTNPTKNGTSTQPSKGNSNTGTKPNQGNTSTTPSNTGTKPNKTTTAATTGTTIVDNSSPSNTNVKPTKTGTTKSSFPPNNANNNAGNTSSSTVPSNFGNGSSASAAINEKAITGGTFWVVAGSYQDPKNADDQLAKILAKGFKDATIVYNEDIRFYRVVVAFTSTLGEAQSLYRKLKSQREPAFFLRG